ncbi:MAG: PaaI family thioesterase [Myxococcales bacterium]|nr:PaaI family thioesterase [Myxococcales bacterium]
MTQHASAAGAPGPPPPNLGPEPGWTLCDPLAELPSLRNYVADDPGGERIRIAYYRDASEPGALKAKVWFGPGAEGPPRHAHGGSLMAVLDEVLGGSVWLAGRMVVLARFEVDLRRPVRLGSTVVVDGRIVRSEGRKVWATGAIHDSDGDTIYAEATGLFVELDAARLATFTDGEP